MTHPCPSHEHRLAIAHERANAALSVPLAWSSLQVTGPDAQTFLQGQMSCDMKQVTAEQASLGCLLSLKGRIEASVIVVQGDAGYDLLMPSAQRETVRSRLAKYAVFSNVTLQPAQTHITGLLGSSALPKTLATTPYATQQTANGQLIRLPGLHRGLRLQDEPATAAPDSAQAAWQAEAIVSGEQHIDETMKDLWQPQELDYHRLGGVSYQKGCYMGQEIVARLYFRGQLKTGLCWLHAPWVDTDASLEWPVMADEKAVGRVLSLAWPDTQSIWLLASVRLDAEALYWQLANGERVALSREPFQRHELITPPG